jgi:hypothetical protein
MIISANSDPHRKEFDELLNSTINELRRLAKTSTKTVSILKGNKLEPYVKDIMDELANGTPFANSIELIGGQRFPDIIANKYYGVEVKTTTQNHWKTTGNSVLESTRVENIERIFMLFAKLASPIEFRCRPYEECLSEVVVTHSPRYLIDMNLEKGKTIFDKIKTPYDLLRRKENPIKPIVEYYKGRLKPGEDLWWIGQDNNRPSGLVIRIWNNLSKSEKQDLKNRAMVYFPEIFSSTNKKYERLPVWLVTHQSVVCPNIRDLYTAQGKGEILIGTRMYKNVPRIFLNLLENLKLIVDIIDQTSSNELSEYWGIKTIEKNKIDDWIRLVSDYSKSIIDAKHLNLKLMLIQKLEV